MAVPAHQAGRADHRGQAGHRRGSGRGVSQAVALEAALSGSVGDPAPDVSTPVLYDISPLIDAGLAVWPGDTPPSREVLLDITSGDNKTLSTLRATVHLGAHADAPSHYGAGGADAASLPPDRYVGPGDVMAGGSQRGRPGHAARPLRRRRGGRGEPPARSVRRAVRRDAGGDRAGAPGHARDAPEGAWRSAAPSRDRDVSGSHPVQRGFRRAFPRARGSPARRGRHARRHRYAERGSDRVEGPPGAPALPGARHGDSRGAGPGRGPGGALRADRPAAPIGGVRREPGAGGAQIVAITLSSIAIGVGSRLTPTVVRAGRFSANASA